MAAARAIPIILCGRTREVATVVIQALKPEYETIHMVFSPTAGAAEIPRILQGKPVLSTNDFGTKNYSQTPVAVVLGGGYSDEDAAGMKKATDEAGAPQVPWLRADTTKAAPPRGQDPKAYGEALIVRLKGKMAEIEKEGKLARGVEGVFWY